MTPRAKEYLLRMGEEKERVFLTGCPAMDVLIKNNLSINQDIIKRKKE